MTDFFDWILSKMRLVDEEDEQEELEQEEYSDLCGL